MNKTITPAAAIIELNRLKDNSVVSDADRRNAAVDIAIKAINRCMVKQKPKLEGNDESQCKYYAPCGLCTFYNTECTEKQRRKSKGKRSCNNRPDKSDNNLTNYIRSGYGLPLLNMEQIYEQHLPYGICIEK